MPSLISVRSSKHGKGVFVDADHIAPGVELVRFEGEVVPLDDVPPHLANYVVRYDRDHYLVPQTMAMFVNHSCHPNCVINEGFGIEAARPLHHGEELSIAYNQVSREEAEAWGAFWDERWTFDCGCGAPNCVGRVDRYLIVP